MTEQNGDKKLEELKTELEVLMNGNPGNYFKSELARTRHEAWFLASALSNVLLIDELKKTRKVLRKFLEKGV